jgi:hypothetical protein
MPRLRKPAMILSAAEQQLIEAIRYTRKLTVIVHADRGQCEVRIARNGGEFAAGSGNSFDTAWRDITEERARRAG